MDGVEDAAVGRGSIEELDGSAPRRVSVKISKEPDAGLTSNIAPTAGDEDGGDIVGPAIIGDSSNANDEIAVALASTQADLGSLRSVESKVSVPDRGADLDASGAASSDAPAGDGGGDTRKGGSLRNTASGSGARGDVDADADGLADGLATASAAGESSRGGDYYPLDADQSNPRISAAVDELEGTNGTDPSGDEPSAPTLDGIAGAEAATDGDAAGRNSASAASESASGAPAITAAAAAAGSSSERDGNPEDDALMPSASSVGGNGDDGSSTSRSGAEAVTAATATAAAPRPAQAATRPRSGSSDADDLPAARGGRRSSYVSPQYDQFAASSSTLSVESRRVAGAAAAPLSVVPSAALSLSRRSGASAGSERPSTGGGSSTTTPRPGSASQRISAAGSPVASRPASGVPRRASETSAAASSAAAAAAAAAAAVLSPGSGSGGGAGDGSGVPPPPREEEELPSQRPSGTASTGAGSSARQGSVGYAWRAGSAGGDSGAAAGSRPASTKESATPRVAALSRSASFASEASSVSRRISGTAAAVRYGDGDGDGGLAAAMVSAPVPSVLLPPLGSQPDAASSSAYGAATDRSAAMSYSSGGEVRRQTSQGTAAPPGPPNPLPPLPSSASSGLLGLGERSKPRSIASAPAGDSRSVSGGTAAGSVIGGSGAATGPAGRPPPPPPPMHLFPTHVQPKGPLDDCTTQAASQHVRTVWSTSNICGIRSLPNALSPDFRDRLYDELVQVAHRDRSFTAPSHRAQLSYGLEGGPLGMPLSVGQKQVARINPLAGMFTQYEYLPSEYDRMKLTGKFDRLKHKLAQTAPSEFVVRAPPAALHGAPAFSEFTYATDPVDSYPASMHADTDLNRSKVVAGPFYPSGRVQTARVLKGRLEECLMRLCKQLSDDWPNSFLQVFEDRNGSVVASFQRASAVAEGDLSSYMNTLAKRDHVVATYQLTKDATRWGLVDEASGGVFYVLWPPWVRHRYLGPHTAPPASETPSGRPGTRGSNSSDEEEEGAEGVGEEGAAGQGQGTDGGDGATAGGGLPMGYANSSSMDAFAVAPGMQRRTGVY